MLGESLIQNGHRRLEGGLRHSGSIPEKRDEIFIRGICESQMESIIEFIFGDADKETYKKEGTYIIFTIW